MKWLYAIIVACLFGHLLPTHAQQQYYPDGTRWGYVKFNLVGRPNIDSTYRVREDKDIYHECVVEGTVVVPISETENMTCQIQNNYAYDFNHELISKTTTLFRQSGDTIFSCSKNGSYYIDEFVYDFRPWPVGETRMQWRYTWSLTDEYLEQRQLADGNYYDYVKNMYFFRTIGMVINGIMPPVSFSRYPGKIAVTHFIRNNTLIYQNNNLIWPEGYTTQIHHPFNDFTGEGRPVYSLQGLVVGNSRNLDALPRGIYIVNGKKIGISR